jgi:hypothetical protein
MSSWLNASIMYTKGVAKGKLGTTHELTEARQGRYHYTMGPYSEPVLHIRPGDRVAVETRDAFEGAIKTSGTLTCAEPVRQSQARKLRRPQVHRRRGDQQEISGHGLRRKPAIDVAALRRRITFTTFLWRALIAALS